MAIVAKFSALPVSGLIPPSHVVQFTDESTGSPDGWLWDFGDGSFSDEQHPLHTYEGVLAEKFTVSLKAFIILNNTGISGVNMTGYKQKISGTFSTVDEAYNDLINGEWFTFSSSSTLKAWYFSDGTGTDEESPTYNAQIRQPTTTLSVPSPSGSGPSVFYLRAGQTEISGPLAEGIITSSLGGVYKATTSSILFLDVTALDGQVIEFTPIVAGAISIIPPQAPFQKAGSGMTVGLREISTDSDNDFDQITKTDYISFADLPVADFDAQPTRGANPLNVQFENKSTVADGISLTYSWKKRLSGSGDSFEEFSTEENPSETFSK
jgi:hypothetical protein